MFCILFNDGKFGFKHLLHVLHLGVYAYYPYNDTKIVIFGSNLTKTLGVTM